MTGYCGFCRAVCSRSRSCLSGLLALGAAAAPALSGGGSAILDSVSCRVPPARKCRSRRWRGNWGFYPLLFLLGLNHTGGESTTSKAIRILQRAANVVLLRLPSSFPAGVAAMFIEHKMATRGLDASPEAGVDPKALECAPSCLFLCRVFFELSRTGACTNAHPQEV